MTRRVSLMAFSMFTVWCCAVLWVRGSDPDTGKKTITNSIGMKLVSIPAGEFQMGSQETAEESARAFEAYGKPKADFFGVSIPGTEYGSRSRFTWACTR